ncbi:hypothetical protein [Paenibacillus mesophilus]|uniref:hypothetical protein n=1 Tax=Paenibacillus mesophilus TaxID=2582849 RepID=UPI001EE3E6C1|nr:hypothetical protein [Paenibacillus mesophilus]
MTYDLFFPEFEVIYGYDDERRLLYAGNSCDQIGEVPYEHLGRGTVPLLFVLTIDGSFPMEKRSMIRQAIETILHHYQEQEPWFPGFINGIRAYDVWIDAFRNRKIEPIGNAYNTAVVHDARRFAAIFLTELGAWQDIGSSGGDRFERLCLDAANRYERVANDFRQLVELFPFQGWGEPNRPENAERATKLLESARRSEIHAVDLMD